MRNFSSSLIHPQFALVPLLLLSLFHTASARPMRMWTPEELYAKADVIIVGMPLDVTSTGRASDVQAQPQEPVFPGIIMRALVEVNHVIKGAAPDEIELEYVALQAQQDAVVDGPMRLNLKPYGVYVLYLRQVPGEAAYSPVLGDEFDSEQSALMIAPAPDFTQVDAPADNSARPNTAAPEPAAGEISTGVPAAAMPSGVSAEPAQPRQRRTYIPQSQRGGGENAAESDARPVVPETPAGTVPRMISDDDTGMGTLEIEESQQDFIGP